MRHLFEQFVDCFDLYELLQNLGKTFIIVAVEISA